jgi:hypothetical protein
MDFPLQCWSSSTSLTVCGKKKKKRAIEDQVCCALHCTALHCTAAIENQVCCEQSE